MSGTTRRILAVLLALAVTAALVALSRAGYATGQGSEALLRLSWSGRPERIERCRALTDEELAERPAHMRQRLECEGSSARYGVRVRTDGRAASLDTVTGGGLRGDRPIHFLGEYPLRPGARAISVEVVRVDAMDAEEADDQDDAEDGEDTGNGEDTDEANGVEPDRGVREREERKRQRQEALPARLALDTTLTVGRGEVVLVTYDRGVRRLVVIDGSRQ
jgi:hypothetical protein